MALCSAAIPSGHNRPSTGSFLLFYLALILFILVVP